MAGAKAAILTSGREFVCQGYTCERALEGLWGQVFTLFLLGYSRGRGPSCRQGISILSPKLIGILKQWSELVVLNNRNGIHSAIWCLVIMLSRFPHEPVLRSRREEQTDLRKNWLQEEGCWNNSHYEWDLVWKCKSPHKILCFSWLVQIKRFLIHELLEEPVT